MNVRKKVDVVMVWKFDRFARSLRQLPSALELFRALNMSFVSCTEAIDTSLPQGEMLFSDHRRNCAVGALTHWR
jgi:DNA invertase Pin-like site-specific DNA recombinase